MRVSWKYVIRRLLFLVAVVWLAATLNFVLPRIVGRDPVLEYLSELQASTSVRRGTQIAQTVEEYRAWAGLNKPLWEQYTTYLSNLLRMDFGRSLRYYRPVADLVHYALPWTLGMLGTSTILAFLLGTIAGALSVWRKDARMLNVAVSFLMVLAVIPPFIIGLLLADVFAFRLKLFPIAGLFNYRAGMDLSSMAWWLDVLHHAALPAISLVLGTAGIYAMSMRGMMVTVMGADYILYGEAKGLKRMRLLVRYAVRNVMLPQTTLLAMSLGGIVSSVTIVEMLFGYPGVGTLLEDALNSFDYNLLQGCVFYLVLAIALATFALDLLYPVIDPRISYEKGT